MYAELDESLRHHNESFDAGTDISDHASPTGAKSEKVRTQDSAPTTTGKNSPTWAKSTPFSAFPFAQRVRFVKRRRQRRKIQGPFVEYLRSLLYFRLAPAKDGDRIVYDTVPLAGAVAVGDLIAVRLTVTGSEWKYMMVEDPIPAGTEFVERDNLFELRNKPPWWEYFFTRRELHDDRMAIFQTYFPQGQQQYFYLLKVVNPGAFQVSPARVGPMYQPAVIATTESRRLEVK
jgi:hypothetical protein